MSDTGKVMIHGKEYQTVAFRVGKFRESRPDWCLVTEIVSRDEQMVVMKAFIIDEHNKIRATGHAEERRDSSTINKTSALENAETSAIGRALAALGLAGTEFASADEVANAIRKQGIHKPSDGAMESLTTDQQTLVKDVAEEVKVRMAAGKTAEAYKWLVGANFDADSKVACWNLLPAHYRTAIDKFVANSKVAAMKNDIPA